MLAPKDGRAYATVVAVLALVKLTVGRPGDGAFEMAGSIKVDAASGPVGKAEGGNSTYAAYVEPSFTLKLYATPSECPVWLTMVAGLTFTTPAYRS